MTENQLKSVPTRWILYLHKTRSIITLITLKRKIRQWFQHGRITWYWEVGFRVQLYLQVVNSVPHIYHLSWSIVIHKINKKLQNRLGVSNHEVYQQSHRSGHRPKDIPLRFMFYLRTFHWTITLSERTSPPSPTSPSKLSILLTPYLS